MELTDFLSTLTGGDREFARQIADSVMALGFAPKVKPDKAGHRCDFVRKPRITLCSLCERGGALELMLKLYHAADYQAALDACSAPVKAQLAAARQCGSHSGGSCKGALRFEIDGTPLSPCRHALKLVNLAADDVPCVLNLLEQEANS